MGGVPEGLLFAGRMQPIYELVADELPNTPFVEGFGHDGQTYYSVALDPLGVTVPEMLDTPSYWYRRILYPAVSGVFGLLRGEPLLWGMIVVAASSVGVASGAVALISRDLALPALAPLTVILNPGTWISARLLTADNLALALGLLAVLVYLRRRNALTVVLLALAILTKEPAAAFAVGVAGHALAVGERSRSVKLAVGAALLPVVWWTFVAIHIGEATAAKSNLALPFVGFFQSLPVWPTQDFADWLYLATTLLAYGVSVAVFRRVPRLWRWLLGPWLAIGAVSSFLVWNHGNNIVRTLAPLITLSALAWTALRPREASPPMEMVDGS